MTTKKKSAKKHSSKKKAGATAAEAAACSITSRQQASQIMLDFLHGKGFPNASENSDFDTDIPVTPNARRAWGFALRDIVIARGCDPGSFGPEDCANAGTVGDIVNALAEALHVS